MTSLLRPIPLLFAAAALVAACDGDGPLSGINTLGQDFVRAFNQGPNDTPLDTDALTLRLTPRVTPFNP
ncbi:MAG: hypothetical protein AAFY59_02135 [Pseudomonadota bacterium]